MMLATVVLLGAATLALCWMIKALLGYLEFKKEFDSIGGPPAYPIVGNAFYFKPDSTDFYSDLLRDALEVYHEKRAMRLWVGTKPYLLLYGERAVEDLLTSSTLISKGDSYSVFREWLRDGLVLSIGAKWKRRRRMLTPSFHFKILDDFMTIFNEQARVMVGRLKEHCGKESFDICPFISQCALDIICETAMGKKINAQQDGHCEYLYCVQKINALLSQRVKSPWKHSDWLYKFAAEYKEYKYCLKTLHDFTRKVIDERKSDYAEFYKEHGEKTLEESVAGKDQEVFGRKKRLAFMDTLLCSTEDGQPLSMEAIQEETDIFMFAGHHTTSSTMSFALYNIGARPEVQQKVHEELDAIFGDSDRDVTPTDVSQMKYLECVVKESMRLFTTVPFLARTMTEDAKLGDLIVRKGTTVSMFLGALHRDPDVFPEPDKFDPDRFLPDNAARRSPFTFVPFSAGPRNCIGQNFAMRDMKTLLSSILREFNIESIEKVEDFKPAFDSVLQPQGGVTVKLNPRAH